ncbi:MAG: hypothetical protein P8P49_00920 [Opitutales bacterium]|nr:hypothetical protein [Opitutales bacterium]
MNKFQIFSSLILASLVFLNGCASKKKVGKVSAEDEKSYKTILDKPVPQFKAVGDPDMDQLIGDTFENYVKGLSEKMNELQSIVNTNRDFSSFDQQARKNAEEKGISVSQASNELLTALKEKADSGDADAQKRLDNISEALTRTEKISKDANKKAINSIALIVKNIAAFQNLKSKVDNAGTFEKIKLGSKFAKGLSQIKDFNSYAKEVKNYTQYLENKRNHPCWNKKA